ncbi:hypothetical protein ACEPAI_9728 [Sanghuangporus weigelae]
MASSYEKSIAAMDQQVFGALTNDERDRREDAKRYLAQTTPYSMQLDSSEDLSKLHDRVIAFHDALARLLINEPKSQVVAVASSLGPTNFNIYVSSNANKGIETMGTHLQALWTLLRETGGIESPEFAKERLELRRVVYNYSWKKHHKRYEKYRRGAKLEKFFASNSVQALPDDQCNILRSLKEVCSVTEQYKEQKSDDNLRELAKHLGTLDSLLRSIKISNEVDNSWNAALERETASQMPFANGFIRFLEKLCTTEHAIQDVLRLLVPSDPLRFILGKDIPQTFEDKWKEELAKANIKKNLWEMDGNAYPHCECVVLAYFINNYDILKEKPYGYIGDSKLSCAGCAGFFDAYNSVANEEKNLPQFYTRGSHSKAYHKWVKPKIDSRHDLEEKIEQKSCGIARAKFLACLNRDEVDISTDSSDLSRQSSVEGILLEA